MSKPVFSDLFKFSGRRNRKSYVLLHLAVLAAIFAVMFMAFFGYELVVLQMYIGFLPIFLALVCSIPVLIISWASASQRIRDFGQSGVWILVSLIPYVGFIVPIAIMLIPSSEGENKYGPSCI